MNVPNDLAARAAIDLTPDQAASVRRLLHEMKRAKRREVAARVRRVVVTVLFYAAFLSLAPLLAWLINGKPWA
jgi:hypothetical protein